jgi:hypothetical protein
MDSITFEVGDVTVQLVDDKVLLWGEYPPAGEGDVIIDTVELQKILSTAHMLRDKKKKKEPK